jgi:hypothetical protein
MSRTREAGGEVLSALYNCACTHVAICLYTRLHCVRTEGPLIGVVNARWYRAKRETT